ncbi:MAG: SurA N-terminal domain-containing protein [Bacteroidaceae bacterium]|nr:SurA N-terminal domain-containing protein [Bacteroidaceae bacterium]
MAAIQKIRSYGVVLISIVGIALFAFIAEELVRALSGANNASRQVVGEIYGENVNYQEFNDLVTEYENVVKMSNGGQNLTEQQSIQLRDQLWQSYTEQKIMEHEAEALGLRVTDAEVQSLINTGTSPVLRSTPFVNQQTGMFDVNILNQFLTNYDEVMNNPEMPAQQKEYFDQMMQYWKFIEKQIRNTALSAKYNSLLSSCMITNPVAVQAEIDARGTEKSILMAALPLATVKDITPTESEIKAKYEELKKQYPEAFDMQEEARSIKYILVPVTASKADTEALEAELNEYKDSLQSTDNISNIVRESRSLVTYNGLPVAKTSLPRDIANEIDSMAPGSIKGPYTNTNDNTMNVIAYLSKVQQPDSVEYSQIVVSGTDAKATATADSILAAVQAGTPMDTIAKKYNQSAAARWLTSAAVDGQQLSGDDRAYVETLLTTPAGTVKKVTATGAQIIVKVTDRRNMIDKYQVAAIKRTIDFSDETHSEAWNKLSSFLAANTKQEDIEANAQKEGYTVTPAQYISSADHYIAGTPGTTEALRWVFNAKKGDVSELLDCGNGNDHMIVVMLTDIHKKGLRAIDDASLKGELEDRVIRDKQAAALLEKMQGAKSVADVAKMEGAVTDTIQHITFAAPVFVQKLGAQEFALTGAVAGAKDKSFVSGVRGNNAVYAFQVLSTTKQSAQADKEQVASQLTSQNAGILRNAMNFLRRKAAIVDNRYKFYQ